MSREEETRQNFKWSKEVEENSFKYYPQRSPQGAGPPSGFAWLVSWIFRGDPLVSSNKCESHVIEAIESDPYVKLMLAALKNAGCPVNPRRHISCENCHPWVTGGYDNRFNQIVICENTADKEKIAGVMAHELLHMYDFCRAELDWNNVKHVACTEIRAANLFHCSIASGIFSGSVNLLTLKKAHRNCVKLKAVASVLAVRPELTKAQAWAETESVFDKCYNDLEPIGRRMRKASTDKYRAYRERFIYGYF